MKAQIPMRDERKTGLKFLQYSKGAFHPGEDLNAGNTAYADLGMPIYAMCDGEVVYVKDGGKGWGNILIVKVAPIEGLEIWGYRMAHFQKIIVKVGDKVKTGDLVGNCGGTGGYSPHCHWEVLKKELSKPTYFPNGVSKAKVLEMFMAPYEAVKRINETYGMPDWAVADWEKCKGLGVLPDSPLIEVDLAQVQKDLVKLGKLKNVEKMPAYRAAVLYSKLGLL